MRLLNNDPGDNSTSVIHIWPRGQKGQFTAWGTWDGATVTLEFSPDDQSTWIAVGTDTTLTANGGAIFQLGRYPLRATISNAGSDTELSAEVQSVQT